MQQQGELHLVLAHVSLLPNLSVVQYRRWLWSQDIQNSRDRIRASQERLAKDDAESVRQWAVKMTEDDQVELLLYQPQTTEVPFILSFSTRHQMEEMVKHSNGKMVQGDDTCSLTLYGFQLHTQLFIHPETKTGAPAIWTVTSEQSADVYRQVWDAAAKRCDDILTELNGTPSLYCPAVSMFDLAAAEGAGFHGSIWQTRGSLYAWCFFHLDRAWLDNLIHKLPFKDDVPFRAILRNELDRIVFASTTERAKYRLERFLLKWTVGPETYKAAEVASDLELNLYNLRRGAEVGTGSAEVAPSSSGRTMIEIGDLDKNVKAAWEAVGTIAMEENPEAAQFAASFNPESLTAKAASLARDASKAAFVASTTATTSKLADNVAKLATQTTSLSGIDLTPAVRAQEARSTAARAAAAEAEAAAALRKQHKEAQDFVRVHCKAARDAGDGAEPEKRLQRNAVEITMMMVTRFTLLKEQLHL